MFALSAERDSIDQLKPSPRHKRSTTGKREGRKGLSVCYAGCVPCFLCPAIVAFFGVRQPFAKPFSASLPLAHCTCRTMPRLVAWLMAVLAVLGCLSVAQASRSWPPAMTSDAMASGPSWLTLGGDMQRRTLMVSWCWRVSVCRSRAPLAAI